MISFDYNIKVYYKDIDKMGVVYYTRYLEYFEAARTEMLKSIGLIVTDIENKGFFLPVVSAHCDYKQGANFELKDDILLASGYTIHGFIDHHGKAKRPPKLFQQVMQNYF